MKRWFLGCALIVLVAFPAAAHVGQHASIHDTVAGVITRMRDTLTAEELKGFTGEKALALLTPEEKRSLGEDYLVFTVNVPVVVSVVHDTGLGADPFWLEARGFTKTADQVTLDDDHFDVWTKDFDTGDVGLGVNSLGGGGEHYFVGVRAKDAGDTGKLEITNVYPGLHSVAALTSGARPWSDTMDTLHDVPKSLDGAVLIRGVQNRRRDARLTGVLRQTEWPATAAPDHVVLTWSNDPHTTQTIQWRTSTAVESGVVAYARKDAGAFNPDAATKIDAETKPIVVNTLVNDPIIHWHTATITGLEPGVTYSYAVGDGKGTWRTAEFKTVPANPGPFSFIYMGDAQNGLEGWGDLIHHSLEKRPDCAFYIMAGDLVNRGSERDDWDSLFQSAEGVWDRKPVVPVPGNHEYQGGGNPELYLDQFALPTGSPLGELNYTLRYGNALFVMLDSNLSAEKQAPWLEEQLKNTDATWKIVVYHHPAYSSGAKRDNPEVRKFWGALFDKYHVDLALQGHDHAYLRTYPMNGQKKVDSAKQGTIYIVSVSGNKYYEQGQFDYTAFGMTNVSTYQVLDIRINGDKLEYGAYDIDGNLRDTFVIEK